MEEVEYISVLQFFFDLFLISSSHSFAVGGGSADPTLNLSLAVAQRRACASGVPKDNRQASNFAALR